MENHFIIPCEKCGATNRVLAGKAGPHCAKCKAPIPTDRPINLTDSHFDQVIGGTSLPVLVNFYASWCRVSKSMHPVVEELAKLHQGRALVGRLDVDRYPLNSGRFDINGVPTFILFSGGREVGRHVGAAPEGKLDSMLLPLERK